MISFIAFCEAYTIIEDNVSYRGALAVCVYLGNIIQRKFAAVSLLRHYQCNSKSPHLLIPVFCVVARPLGPCS